MSIQEIIEEIDEDGSGELEFAEFIQLAAKFLIEEDEEEMKWELREAFRLYDKQGIFFAVIACNRVMLVIYGLSKFKIVYQYHLILRKWIHYNWNIKRNFA